MIVGIPVPKKIFAGSPIMVSMGCSQQVFADCAFFTHGKGLVRKYIGHKCRPVCYGNIS
jgi:hypothetical protein